MTQQSVINILKKKKEWMTSKQIAKILKITSKSVSAALNKLLKQEIVLRKTLTLKRRFFSSAGYQPYLWRIK